MENFARNLKCKDIHVTGLKPNSTARAIHPSLLLNVGYELETIGLSRRIEPSKV